MWLHAVYIPPTHLHTKSTSDYGEGEYKYSYIYKWTRKVIGKLIAFILLLCIPADMKWTVVMPTYMGKSPKGMKDQISWLAFLEKIGVKRNIVVEKVNVKVKKVRYGYDKYKQQNFCGVEFSLNCQSVLRNLRPP